MRRFDSLACINTVWTDDAGVHAIFDPGVAKAAITTTEEDAITLLAHRMLVLAEAAVRELNQFIDERHAPQEPPKRPMITMTYADWVAEGERRFGTDRLLWKFVCPSCGHVATPLEWKELGAPEGAVAFSCVGRWVTTGPVKHVGETPGPCNYTGGGLFKLNPVTVPDQDGVAHALFAFAEVSDGG